jgi:hypothetical protein
VRKLIRGLYLYDVTAARGLLFFPSPVCREARREVLVLSLVRVCLRPDIRIPTTEPAGVGRGWGRGKEGGGIEGERDGARLRRSVVI